jgi:hypothetical protein
LQVLFFGESVGITTEAQNSQRRKKEGFNRKWAQMDADLMTGIHHAGAEVTGSGKGRQEKPFLTELTKLSEFFLWKKFC